MLSFWGYQREDGHWTIFYDEEHIPETIKNSVVLIEVGEKPVDGNEYVLNRNVDSGDFYWELFTQEIKEPEESQKEPTVEERLARLEETSARTYLQVDYLTFLAELSKPQ